MRLRFVVVVFLGLMVFVGGFSEVLAASSVPRDDVSKGRGEYINEADIPLAYANQVIGTVKDSRGATHSLKHRFTATSKMKISFIFELESSTENDKDRYITLETYKDINDVLTPILVEEQDTYGRKGSMLRADFYKTDLIGQPYVYFRLGAASKKNSFDYSGSFLFKVSLAPHSLQSDVIEGSYVIYNNESTSVTETQSVSLNKRAKESNQNLPLKAYQIDATIPAKWGAKKNNLLQMREQRSVAQMEKVGSDKDFWVMNYQTGKSEQLNAKLAYIGSKSKVWVHQDEISSANAELIGKEFDGKIYSTVTAHFGRESDVDQDGKINILLFDIQDGFEGENDSFMGGYFNQNDVVNGEYSNHQEVLYIDTYPSLGKNKDDVSQAYSTIVHEFQHLVNHNHNVLIEGNREGMDVWLDEALSMAAEQLYSGKTLTDRIDYYNQSLSIANGHSLLHWDYEGDTLANYSLSYLFGQYLKQQARQGNSIFKEIIEHPKNNHLSVDAVIKKYIDKSMSFGKFTTHFRTALILKEQTGLAGFYGDPVVQNLQPRLYAGSLSRLVGGGAVVVKLDPLAGFFKPSNIGGNISYTIVSTNSIPVSRIPVNRFVVKAVSDQDEVVTGIAYVNGTVEVSKKDKTVIGKGTVASDGQFSVQIPKQANGTELVIYTQSPFGQGAYHYLTVSDKTPPAKPTVYPFKDSDTKVTGYAHGGSKAYVVVDGKNLGWGYVDSAGRYTIQIPFQEAGTILSVYTEDYYGNKSEEEQVTVEKTPPQVPVVYSITNEQTVITGFTDKDCIVYVKNGATLISKGVSNGSGDFNITIPKQKVGTELTIIAEDSYGLVSETKVAVIPVPTKPKVSSVGDGDTTVKGTATPGLKIVVKVKEQILGEAVATEKGNFTVKIGAKQKAGTSLSIYAEDEYENRSPIVVVKVVDRTPPKVPTIKTVITSKTTKIEGTAEAGSTVYLYKGTKQIAKTSVNQKGQFTISIKPQTKGTKLTTHAIDKAGNRSAIGGIVVK
jgi:large repetitive protein